MILPNRFSPVVYLSSEFAIDNELPTYAGGLGVLAGDYMHAAASLHMPTVGIGILYKGNTFLQHITGEGKEEKRDSEFDHDTSFLRQTTVRGKQLTFQLPTHGNPTVKAYHLRLSEEVVLFFLSTDVDQNPHEWISDMDALYRGDIDSQIRQELLLGVGGVMLLEALRIKPRLLHFNEGRPIFAMWEFVKMIMQKESLSFDEAWDKAKKHIVYTNHTLVAAGNPMYPLDRVQFWAESFANELGVSVERIIKPGKKDNQFSITDFALNVSTKQSAVSEVHGTHSKKTYPSYDWVAITNGVHMPRWQDSDYRNPTLCDQGLWEQHMIKKRELVKSVIERTGFGYDENRLVISWARRLAEYKQPKAIFKDIERLKSIVSNPDTPVQILYAGNSHSADPNAKSLIDEIISIFSTDLHGHAIFVPNYNIALANHLTSGSDVWLNTPKGNLEACGTSGMKAISNGVLQCTVLDGWTYEVDWEGIGWTLDPDNVADNFYDVLQNELIPLYFHNRDHEGRPVEWIKRMRASIELSKRFTAENMLQNYEEKLYSKINS